MLPISVKYFYGSACNQSANSQKSDSAEIPKLNNIVYIVLCTANERFFFFFFLSFTPFNILSHKSPYSETTENTREEVDRNVADVLAILPAPI